MVTTNAVSLDEVRGVLETVTDPEIPVLTIEDMGILRDLALDDDGKVIVTITPTYSGCPAMEVIAFDIVAALEGVGVEATVVTSLSPAWTTDWMSEDGRRKLSEFGIAPPGRNVDDPLTLVEEIRCPYCASLDVRVVSEFGSTACKRMFVCGACLEPFDHFKAI